MPAAIHNPYDYQVLGLAVHATDEEIRAAYKKLALQWHPDRHLTAKEHAAQMFVEVNRAYHSLMAAVESVHSCEDSVSPAFTPSESDTLRSSSPSPIPQATQSSHRPASPVLRKNVHTAPLFTFSARSSSSAKSSPSRSLYSETSHHTSSDHHSNQYPHSTKLFSRGSDGTSQIPSSKSYDNLRHPLRSPLLGRTSPPNADGCHNSRTGNPLPHSKSHDILRDHLRDSHESESSQVPPSTPYFSRSEASAWSKSNFTAQEAGPMYNFPKGGSRDLRSAKLSRRRADKTSRPVIPPTASKLHKRSRMGLGEEFFNKLSKVSSKAKKDEGLTFTDNAPTYGSPLRPLGTPRGPSKDWFFPLPLTLNEMFHGAAYQFLVTRELLSHKTEQVEISVEVPPGTRSGTRIVCPCTGHQNKDGTLQDIIFLVEGVPHGQFMRVKDDLFMDICVPWMETLAEHGADICIDGMDGEQFSFTLPYPIYDERTEGEVFIKGAGMPIRQGRKTVGRGNLIVRWEVAFSNPSKWKAFKKVLRIKA